MVVPLFGNWIPSPFRKHGSEWGQAKAAIENEVSTPASPRERYAIQRRYFFNNGLYQDLQKAFYEAGITNRAMRGLRNPAYRICEFYQALLWPGSLPDALPIAAENESIIPAIEQAWSWSNWGEKKELVALLLPMLGDVFLKAATREDGSRVFIQVIDPDYVVDFEKDERGFLTMCRIDIPQKIREGNVFKNRVHTEVWRKDTQTYQLWRHDRGMEVNIDRLGPPDEERSFAEWGIDFVPIVHCLFDDVGEDRGVGAFWLQLDKIDEVNAQATRLAQLLYRYNKATWAMFSSGRDSDGRPIPPPRIAGEQEGEDGPTITLGDDQILKFPAGWEMAPLIANINYEAHRLLTSDSLLDLQRDRPEMAYWTVTELGGPELSGRALRYKLMPAINKLLQVRGRSENALARLDAMLLTIGSNMRLPLFRNLGTYEAGDFEHRFGEREVIHLSDLEEAQGEQSRAEAFTKLTGGTMPMTAAMQRIYNMTEQEAVEMTTMMAEMVERQAEEGGEQ